MSLVIPVITSLLTGCPDDDLNKEPGDLKGQFCEPVSGAGIGRVAVQLFYDDGTSPVDGFASVGDASGRFELLKIPPGDYVVKGTFGAVERSMTIVIESTLTTEFTDPGCHPPIIPPLIGGIVEGQTCDDAVGAWVGFASVWLSSPGNAGDVLYPAVSDVEGRFIISNVAPGTYDAHVEKDAFSQTFTNVVVTEQNTTNVSSPLACEAPPGGTVEGNVCEDGVGWVSAARAYINLAGGTVAEATTDANGHFSIPNVTPGVQVVRVEKDLFARSWQVTVQSAQTVTVLSPATCDVIVPPVGSGTVVGRVCAPDGQTWLAGATVLAGDPNSPTSQTTTDAEGNYTLTGVPEGMQTITVRKNSFTATYTVTVPANGTVTVPVAECAVIPTSTRVAVLTGLYDNVRCVLTGQSDPEASLAGHVCSIPGLGLDPANVTSIDARNAAGVSALLGDYERMRGFDIIFFNYGIDVTRIPTSPQRGTYAANLRQFVEQGGSVYASDWAAAVVEQAFPEFVGWQNGSGTTESIDPAKVGAAGALTANVVDPGIRAALGQSTVELSFDLAVWVMMRQTALATRVYIRGNPRQCAGCTCQPGATVNNVPLTVGFDVGQGRVVFTSFHQERNITDDMLQVLNLLVFEL